MTVEELEIIIRTNNKDTKQKIAEVKKQLDSLKQSADKGDNSVNKLSKGISLIKTGAAVAGLKALSYEIKKLTNAYAVKQAAQLGLESILESQNKNVEKAKAFLTEYTKDGLIPLTNAYAAYKQLASAGYDDEQTQSILKNLKDSASFGRQNALTMGEAVQSATEGIKNQNSILVDNAGVTKNLSVMWEEYAKSIGKTVGNLTAEEQRIATVNGLMRETAYQTGNAAKYANTYAGAQAMLKTQTTLLSAAIGSVLAPAFQTVMPYITSAVEKLTAMAERAGQIAAILFNIDSKKSSTENLAAGAQKAASGMSTATKKAKELKRALLGIDELNILSKPTGEGSSSKTNSTTTSTATGADSIATVDPALNSKLDELKKKATEIREKFEAWKPTLKGVGAAGALAIGMGIIGKVKAAADKVPLLSKGFSVLKNSVKIATDAMKSGVNPIKAFSSGFKSLWSSAKNFMGSLSPFAKMGVSLVALTAQTVVTKNAVKDYALGNISLGETLGNIIPVTAAVGVAMYTMLGPWGLVAAAVAGVTAAIVGVNEAQEQLQQKAIDNAFYDGVGVKISDIASKFTSMKDAIVASNKPIIDNQAVIDATKKKIGETSAKIDTLIGGVNNGTISISEALPKITAAFDQLKADTKTILDTIYKNITYSLAGSIGDVLISMGVSMPEVLKIFGSIVDESKSKLETLYGQVDLIKEQLKTAKGDEKFSLNMRLLDLKQQINSLTGSDELSNLSVSLGMIKDGINFERPKAFQEAMSKIKTAADDAKDSIDTANGKLIEQAEILRKIANPEQIKVIEKYIEAIKLDTKNQKDKIDAQMQVTAEAIQKSFVSQYQKAVEKASPTIVEILKGAFTDNKNTYYWAGIYMKGRVLDGILSKDGVDLEAEFKNTFGDYGRYSLKGYTDGIKDATAVKEATDATSSFGKVVQNVFSAMMGIESPSTVFEKYGINTVVGYANGITGNSSALKAISTLATNIFTTFKNHLSNDKFRSIGDNAAQGITDGLRGIRFPQIKVPHFSIQYDTRATDSAAWQTLGIQGQPKVDVNWYGKGGIFGRKSVIGVGENGDEAVLPLENNTYWMDVLADKIDEKIPRGSSGSDGGDWTIILQRADGSEESRYSITAAQRKNQRDGKTIIPVGV